MAAKRRFFVQFTVSKGGERRSQVGLLLEQLRYAGLLVYTDKNGDYVVAIEAPKGVEGPVWCDMQANRMRSFGFTALVVTK